MAIGYVSMTTNFLRLFLMSWTVRTVWVEGRYDGPWLHSTALPCVFESRLVVDRSWFGFIANMTFGSTGRLTFEFSYPVERCCQNILFYSEQQVGQLSDRLNCWQREYMLNPEEDQILRLTPKFSWSGCHLTHPNNVATYVCKGGRSFIREGTTDLQPTTWYVAVSNCPTLAGIELTYRVEAYGLVGDCPTTATRGTPTDDTPQLPFSSSLPPPPPPTISRHPSPPLPTARESVPGVTASAGSSPVTPTGSVRPVCRVEGDLNVSASWYGFIANISIGPDGGGFAYRFSYPYYMHAQNVILYGDEDMARLGWSSSQCWLREAVIRSQHLGDKIMELSYRATWNGCESMNTSHGRNLTCRGERRFDGPRRIYVAVSNCRSVSGLLLNFRFDVVGYDRDMCSGSRTAGSLRTCDGLRAVSFALTMLLSGARLV